MWLFLASEAMLFGSLFSGYVMLRAGSTDWPGPVGGFPWLETVLLVGASAAFGAKRSQLDRQQRARPDIRRDQAAERRGADRQRHHAVDRSDVGVLVHAHGRACRFTSSRGAVFTGWLAGPSFAMAAEERERWPRASKRRDDTGSSSTSSGSQSLWASMSRGLTGLHAQIAWDRLAGYGLAGPDDGLPDMCLA